MRSLVGVASLMVILGALRADAYEVAAVQNGGSISGQVRFEGKAPEPKKMTITKDSQVCGNGERVVGAVTVDASGSLQGAVVYIDQIAVGKAWPPSQDGFMIDQEGCRFLPSAPVMRKGETVRLRNKDGVMHNSHAYELIGSSRVSIFNFAQMRGSESKRDLPLRRGNEVKLECDVHNFMHEWFLVLDHPYFAPTGLDGKFGIGEVPRGTYKLVAWHSVLGRKETTIEVKPGATAAADFVFTRP